MCSIHGHKNVISYLMVLAGLIYLFSFRGTTAILAQTGNPFVRQVRALEADETGISNPVGLAFSPEAKAFYVVEGRGPGQAPPANTDLIKLSLAGDRAGSTRIAAAIQDPINMAYDSRFKRVLIYQTPAHRLLEVLADGNGKLDPSKMIGHDMRYLNLQNPQGLTVDPVSGDIFILDSGGPQLVHIGPEADGGIDQAEQVVEDLSETDLVNPRGLAFDPTTGHLQVVNPAEQELYELSQTGQVVTTRNLVALDLSDPQGMVFAPSGESTDDPATMNLYVANRGPGSGPFEVCLPLIMAGPEVGGGNNGARAQPASTGSGEIVELSLGGGVASAVATSQSSLNTAASTSILDVRAAAGSDDAEERSKGPSH
jgi:DNA-binding beta-propeller fold protein YncE